LLLWATLAWLTTATARLPPFQLMALAFAGSFGLALLKWGLWRERVLAQFRLPVRVWAVGLFGLFGYHAFFFAALRRAPPAEANLINYLWPLLLALLSSMLPGERLRWWHLAGCALGFSGAALVASGGGSFAFRFDAWAGYLAALACAVIWPVYSLLSRRLGKVSSNAVGALCGAIAALCLVLHLLLERWVQPTAPEWGAVTAMGLGPLGLALFAWDIAMKKGRVRALAAASYLEPLFSTLVLIALGTGRLSPTLALSCGLIVAGAVTGGWDALAATAGPPAAPQPPTR
ncbi:MAG: aromatic amino acid exporter YddG, partial [Myxococcaceae bacterium]